MSRYRDDLYGVVGRYMVYISLMVPDSTSLVSFRDDYLREKMRISLLRPPFLHALQRISTPFCNLTCATRSLLIFHFVCHVEKKKKKARKRKGKRKTPVLNIHHSY